VIPFVKLMLELYKKSAEGVFKNMVKIVSFDLMKNSIS